jgi:hypothetical protein
LTRNIKIKEQCNYSCNEEFEHDIIIIKLKL